MTPYEHLLVDYQERRRAADRKAQFGRFLIDEAEDERQSLDAAIAELTKHVEFDRSARALTGGK